MKKVSFFNNKGGVGKTSLVYHLSWMLADKGVSVLAADLDPQANLTSMFLAEERLEQLWGESDTNPTVYGAVSPILRGTGDISEPHVETITERLRLVPGDLGLSRFEDKLGAAWPLCHNRDEAAFRTMTAFHRIIRRAAGTNTQVALVDVGPNLGAINRAALIATDLVYVPLAPDLFSLQGLRNLGPALREWRSVWKELREKAPRDLAIPKGEMSPSGYIVMQHGVRDSRPVKAYERWLARIPRVYREVVLDEPAGSSPPADKDSYALALLKHYRSLMPMAMEARKPMFFLKPADGAIGAHTEAVRACYADFLQLARKIAGQCGISL